MTNGTVNPKPLHSNLKMIFPGIFNDNNNPLSKTLPNGSKLRPNKFIKKIRNTVNHMPHHKRPEPSKAFFNKATKFNHSQGTGTPFLDRQYSHYIVENSMLNPQKIFSAMNSPLKPPLHMHNSKHYKVKNNKLSQSSNSQSIQSRESCKSSAIDLISDNIKRNNNNHKRVQSSNVYFADLHPSQSDLNIQMINMNLLRNKGDHHKDVIRKGNMFVLNDHIYKSTRDK